MTDRSGRRMLVVVAALVGLATAAHVVHDGLEAQEADACAVCHVAHSPGAEASAEAPTPTVPQVLAFSGSAPSSNADPVSLLSAAPSRAPPV